jgi:predicted esterase
MKLTRPVLICLFAAGWMQSALPQSLPNLPLARLQYTVRKRTTKADGDLKAKLDANDRELAEATRAGKQGEVRRLIAKGMTLLDGKEWTPELDFERSLALRSDHAFVDTAHPWTLRLEQIYSPSIALEHSLTAHVSIRKFQGGRGGGAANPETVKDAGTFDEVSRDLAESPYLFELDLSSLPDGAYTAHVEVMDGSRSLGSANMRFTARKDLDSALAQLRAAAKSAPETVRADVEYPADYVRNVNLGRYDIGQFDVNKEIATAEETLKIAQSGKNPFADRRGDFKRHYLLAGAGEIMPYRLFIPKEYDGSRAFPLVVALHGLGGTEDSMFGQNYRMLPEVEKRGYILVAPLGYRIDGFYGRTPETRASKFSEEDVMTVLARVRRDYKIDDQRIYLMGHSMGGIGTWTLGAKHSEIWAALGPISGVADPRTVEKMRAIPEVVVHGDDDNTVPVSGSRAMVAEMKRLGVDVKYIEVPGGSHTSVPGPNMSAIFDFFDTHKKGEAGASARQ